MKTSAFDYELPPSAIAQEPIEPRHAARMLDTRTMTDRRFADLPGLLEPGDVVVVNRTRVRRARLVGRKPTGGTVEVLLLHQAADGTWTALARPTRRLRRGTRVVFGEVSAVIVAGPKDGVVTLVSSADLDRLAADVGEVPLPPYFSGTLEDPERYQTMFADRLGSAAAPTAGLHFTQEVATALEDRGVSLERIDLEVGLDTFRPISTDLVEDHPMHSEHVRIGADTAERIEAARASGGRVVAVGTTVVRALETAAAPGAVVPIDAPTRLFITPGYRFHVVDLVVTNFHVPGSTLVVMLASILGERWRDVYSTALERGYRFLSFGDAMLAEVPR